MATLILFTHDLRIHDNPALVLANTINKPLICLYCVNFEQFDRHAKTYGLRSIDKKRWQLLSEGLQELNEALKPLGQKLLTLYGKPEDIIPDIIKDYGITELITSRTFDGNKNTLWQRLKKHYPQARYHLVDSYTLFSKKALAKQHIEINKKTLSSFSTFRRKVEDLIIQDEALSPNELPPPLTINHTLYSKSTFPLSNQHTSLLFSGGESSALKHLNTYFSSHAASTYKETRNALDGWNNSCKFSPWLAQGSLSAKRIFHTLTEYEARHKPNESTYWIYFELLWREYFQWYAYFHKEYLFDFSGINHKKPLTSFYPQRFKQWCQGDTPWPLVNACMKELNQTGYLSNRGRQIVASCLVNELQLDWRCGAAYFQQQLLDYDVAVNWGNWQYIAGVGADPRGGRHFNIEKQQSLYDPDNQYIDKWLSLSPQPSSYLNNIDYLDAADWPVKDYKAQ